MRSEAALKIRREAYRAQFVGARKAGVVPKFYPLQIPVEVLADRKKRAGLFPRDITARLLGDPLPGYSEAERVRVVSPSIVHDRLDDLIFGRVSVL